MLPCALKSLIALLLVPAPALLSAQERSPLDPGNFGVVLDVPGTERVKLEANVTYWRSGPRELQIDVYKPPQAGAPRPAVVFLNAIGDRMPDRVKEWGIYRTWPRLIAAHGMVGISMDCDGEHVQESLAALFTFLEREGARHGVDGGRIGVYAASANVTEAARYLMGSGCAPGIRAAALFYGWPDAPALRRDLPVLCITAESDAVRGSELLDGLWTRVMSARAPWTLQYASGLPHAFDAFADNDASRRILQQAIAFWRSHLEPVPQPPWKPSPERAIAEAAYWGDTSRALTLLGDWIIAHPDEPAGYAQRGVMLARAQRGREAKPDLEKALALGWEDPNARGCLGMVVAAEGDHRRAVELLQPAVEAGWTSSQILGVLGHSLLLLERNEEAVHAYEQAFELGIPPGPTTQGAANYNLACGYARLGRKEEALTCVERAVAARFGNRSAYEADSDFATLRNEERFLIALDALGPPR